MDENRLDNLLEITRNVKKNEKINSGLNRSFAKKTRRQ